MTKSVLPADDVLLKEWSLVPGARVYEEDVINFAHTILMRYGNYPETPDSSGLVLAGEVGELVAWIHREGVDSGYADQWLRAAELLERQAAPVPVASDVHFEFVVFDADYCTQAGGIAPTYAQAVSEGQNYLAQYQQDGPHTLEVRRVEVLPLPDGEVEE